MFELNQPIRANLLLEELGMDPCLEGDPLLTSVAAIERGEGGSLCFATREATTHDAAVVVTTPALAPRTLPLSPPQPSSVTDRRAFP